MLRVWCYDYNEITTAKNFIFVTKQLYDSKSYLLQIKTSPELAHSMIQPMAGRITGLPHKMQQVNFHVNMQKCYIQNLVIQVPS